MNRLLWIALALLLGLLINTVVFWGDSRFLSPFMPLFIVALVLVLARASRF